MVRWADPTRIADAVRSHAEAIREAHPDVSRVLWYGSWVRGVPTPSSDVDLCVVVRKDARRPRDRIPDFLPTRFPVGIDLVVVTEGELAALGERSPSWHAAITSGRTM